MEAVNGSVELNSHYSNSRVGLTPACNLETGLSLRGSFTQRPYSIPLQGGISCQSPLSPRPLPDMEKQNRSTASLKDMGTT